MLVETVAFALSLSFGIGQVFDEIEPSASVDLRAESRVRPAGHVDSDALVAGEIEVVAGATAGLNPGPVALALRYSPAITFTSYDPLSEPLLLHQAMARAYMELGGRWRLFGAHMRQHGERNFTAALTHEEEGGRRLRLEFLPDVERLPIRSHYSTFGLSRASGRWSEYRFLGGYSSFGGRGEAARRRLPKQSGPRIGAEADLGFSGRDALLIRARGSRTELEPGPTFLIGELESGWRHQLKRRTEVSGLVGLFGGYNEEPLGSELRSVLLPILRGELIHTYARAGRHAELEIAFLARPWINQLEATLDPRVSIETGVEWSLGELLNGRLDMGQAWVLDESFLLDGRIFAMGKTLSLPLNAFLDLEGGMRLFRQRVRYGVGWWGPSQWRWDLFLALSVQSDLWGAR